LDWGVKIWDVDEAVAMLKGGEKVLWVDTRPESFFSKGTVRGAVNIAYDKKGSPGDTLTSESLAAAITSAGLAKETAKVIFFCQGPKCHRSYNATYTAVTEWGYGAEQVVWFREGYPYLFKAVKEDAKLNRKAKAFVSDEGLTQL
jgi:3-mercaptopyruvate sulfurtransferase SseA